MSNSVVLSMLVVGGLGLAFGIILAWLSKRFAESIDPRIEKVAELLPGANCGACGWASCRVFAEALVNGETSVDGCLAGGGEVAEKIAEVLGVEAKVKEKEVAVLLCGGGEKIKDRFSYDGLLDCRAAQLMFGGMKECRYGCLGLGSCEAACPFGAIRMEGGLPIIDPELCTGCGVCVKVCPKDIIILIPASKRVVVRCNSKDKGATVAKICEVGCIGCQKCEKVCEFDAIKFEDNLAQIDYTKCTDCGKCIEVCPKDTITNIQVQYEKIRNSI